MYQNLKKHLLKAASVAACAAILVTTPAFAGGGKNVRDRDVRESKRIEQRAASVSGPAQVKEHGHKVVRSGAKEKQTRFMEGAGGKSRRNIKLDKRNPRN